LLADIPGIIEGAHKGKGLGIVLLRHVERTLVLVHLIDVYAKEITAAYQVIEKELASYQIDLTKRPQIVVLNKIDGYDKGLLEEKIKQLKTVVKPRTKIVAISAVSGENTKEFIDELYKIAVKERAKQANKLARKMGDQTPVIRLSDDHDKWRITKSSDGYLVSGNRIEKFASRTDFTNAQSKQRLLDIMKKMGIMHEFARMKVDPGTNVQIGGYGSVQI
jgi:GTP-binding protein